MLKYGTHWQFSSAILLVGITFIPKILASENYNSFQPETFDFIDVAKEAPSGRGKGHTTRIFTTDDGLDEKFWLKYLGEDIRHAVHLQVDGNNNVIPVQDKRPQHQTIEKYDSSEEQQTRFVRQSSQHDNKQQQEPVGILYKQNKRQYPTEKPEIFHVKFTTTTFPTSHHTKHESTTSTQPKIENRKLARHRNKLPLPDKYNHNVINLKPQRTLKAIHEPIVVHLPEMQNSEHQINEKHVPLVVQIPPIIYHQKAELYPENLHD